MRQYGYPIRPPAMTELVHIECDRCHRDMAGSSDMGHVVYHEGASFKLSFGYGSRHDLEKWEFDLCDSCCEQLKALFQLPAELPDTTSTVVLP